MSPALLQLIIMGEPLAMTLAKDIAALFKKHPQLSPDDIALIVGAIHTANADTLAVIAADQAAHPPQ